MAQLFHPSMNTISRASIFGLLLLAGTVGALARDVYRSPWVSGVYDATAQPVPFSHKHHVGGMGLDCRYCHTSVENSNFAGLPSTQTCMTCHSMIWPESPNLAAVRESWATGKPIAWTRVHDLPDFVYFNHSIHIKKGVGCETCHGNLAKMPLTWSENTLYMEWCLKCHRNPENFLRPRSEVFTMGYTPAGDQAVIGAQLMTEYKVQRLTDCSVCHR